METKVNFTLVGLFVLVLGATAVGGGLWLASGKAYRKAYDIYYAYMTESVSGLNRNAPVKYRGVDVGRVKLIELAPGDVERVLLVLEIEQGTPIKQDTLAVLRSQGLTGIAYVELTGGSRDSPKLIAKSGQAYPIIETGPSLMVRLDNAITALLTNLNESSENFNALIDRDNRHAFRQTLVDLQMVARTLAARSSTIDSALARAARTMENTARLTADLPRLMERVERSAGAFENMSAELARAGANANTAIDAARDEARRFSGQTVSEIQMLVVELRELTGSLKRASEQFERDPSVLLFGKPAHKKGPGEDKESDADR